MGRWQQAYAHALRQAIDVLDGSLSPTEVIATLKGYRAFMDARPQDAFHATYGLSHHRNRASEAAAALDQRRERQ